MAILLLVLITSTLPIPYALSEVVPEQPPCPAVVDIEAETPETHCCGKRCVLGMDVEEMVIWRPGDPLPFGSPGALHKCSEIRLSVFLGHLVASEFRKILNCYVSVSAQSIVLIQL